MPSLRPLFALALALALALPAHAQEEAADAADEAPAAPDAPVAPAAAAPVAQSDPENPEDPESPEPSVAPTTPAEAQAAGAPTDKKDDKKKGLNRVDGTVPVGMSQSASGFPLHASASLTNSLGQGTFQLNPNNPNFTTSLSLTPLLFWGDFIFLASQSVQIEWTQSDLTTNPQQLELSDTFFAARYRGIKLPDLNLNFLFTGAYQAPLSLASRQAGSLGSFGLGARATYFNPGIGMAAYLNGSATVSALVPAFAGSLPLSEARPYDDRNAGSIIPAGCLVRSNTEINNYACGVLPSIGRVAVGAGTSWVGLEGNLIVGADVGFTQLISVYVSPDDEYTSEYARPGLGGFNFTTGNLGVTYVALPWLSLTAGAQSFQPLLTADGKWMRFPFWDFISPYSNWSQFYFDMTFSI